MAYLYNGSYNLPTPSKRRQQSYQMARVRFLTIMPYQATLWQHKTHLSLAAFLLYMLALADARFLTEP